MNLRSHTLVLDGMFTEDPRGTPALHQAPPPSDAEVAAELATIRHRALRLLVHRGPEPGDAATGPAKSPRGRVPIMAGKSGGS